MRTPSLTARILKFLAGTFLTLALIAPAAVQAEMIDPAAEEFAVTAEMLDADHADYDEGAVDLIGASIYKYIQFGGDKAALSPEQLSAAEGYYDRYESSPFFALSNLWITFTQSVIATKQSIGLID